VQADEAIQAANKEIAYHLNIQKVSFVNCDQHHGAKEGIKGINQACQGITALTK